jgi:two-component system NtrC family sensor kinase
MADAPGPEGPRTGLDIEGWQMTQQNGALRNPLTKHLPVKTLAFRLTLSFVFIILMISAIFTVVGLQFIAHRTMTEAQMKVRNDLNAAHEIYLGHLQQIYQTIRLSSERFYLRNAIIAGDISNSTGELTRTLTQEGLDVLTVTDSRGGVLYRAHNPSFRGDTKTGSLLEAVLDKKIPIRATSIIPGDELRRESTALAERAYIKLVDTPKARPRPETEQTSGMMLEAAAPIFDYNNNLIGVLCGGVLLNRHYDIVDKIKQTVYRGMQYGDKDVGTATIFLDDVRISTNVLNTEGERAIGTRIAETVYHRVVETGEPWINRAFVVNDWYITAYEPIRDVTDRIIGILYVGMLEAPYADVKQRTTILFLAIALGGTIVAVGFSYVVSSKVTVPVKKLVLASREIADGNLDTQVTIRSDRELAELAEAFNSMAAALQTRDEKLTEFATKRIMESERLAVIGKLAADVAHELNNPLQGIVTYSNLLLEKLPAEDPSIPSIEKIIKQATRCTTIVRGLLDFARQRKPNKRPSDMNAVVSDCLSLVEHRAVFHNIHIVRKLGDRLLRVVVDPSQVEQVFMNLIMNAAEAMNGNGRLTVSTRLDPTGAFVEVDFTDTGHGITEENMERIFDPFFTTKEAGHGTGLGLAISYGIVKEHEGTISVVSKVGKGATFTVRFPVAAEGEVTNSGNQRNQT